MENKIIFTMVITIAIVFLFVTIGTETEKQIIPAKFILSEKTGFDLTPNELTFGKIEINQSAARDITLYNNLDKSVEVLIKSSGEISRNLIVSENNFKMNPYETKNITFSIQTKGLIEFKEYSGKVIIISKKI